MIRHFGDGTWPARVEAVILADDRYEAMDRAEDYREARGLRPVSEDPKCDVAALIEEDAVEGVHRV